jgi:hypothetical protein
MSALLLKADVCGANRHVGFGPKADVVTIKSAHRSAATRGKILLPPSRLVKVHGPGITLVGISNREKS